MRFSDRVSRYLIGAFLLVAAMIQSGCTGMMVTMQNAMEDSWEARTTTNNIIRLSSQRSILLSPVAPGGQELKLYILADSGMNKSKD